MPKPYFWPSNLPWNDSYVIVAELESYPPVYVLSTGTRIRGELPLSELKRFAYENQTVKKKSKKRKSRKIKRRSRKFKRRSRKSKRKIKRKSRKC
jgi:hypothetical protein